MNFKTNVNCLLHSTFIIVVLTLLSTCCHFINYANCAQQANEVSVNVPIDLKSFVVKLHRVEETGKDLINFRGTNVSYITQIGIGNPPKQFDAIFSTKSKVTLVPYKFHANIFTLINPSGYHCDDSSKCKRKNFNFNLPTSSGTEFNVSTYIDIVSINGQVNAPSKADSFLNYNNQEALRFWHHFGGVKTSLTSKLAHVALAPVSAHTCKTLLESIVGEQNDEILLKSANEDTKTLDQVFSVAFSPDAKEMTITFGSQPQANLLNETSIRLTSETDWRIRMQPFFFKNRRLCGNEDCNAILNTASDSIVGPQELVSQIYDELNAFHDTDTKLYTVDCTKISEFPNLVFNFVGERRSDTISVTIKPRQYIKVFKPSDRIYCYVDIKQAAAGVKDWQLGTIFMSRVLSIFDVKNQRIALVAGSRFN